MLLRNFIALLSQLITNGTYNNIYCIKLTKNDKKRNQNEHIFNTKKCVKTYNYHHLKLTNDVQVTTNLDLCHRSILQY